MAKRVIYRTAGERYQEIEVIEDEFNRYLRFGRHGGWQGALSHTRPNRIVFPYQRAFASLVETIPNLASFLSIGVGTGTALRTLSALHPNSRLCGIDIDASVMEVATRFFDAPPPDRARYLCDDGIAYVRNTNEHHSLIFVDTYSENAIYPPSLDPNFTNALCEALEEGGVAAYNVISTYPVHGRVQQFIDAGLHHFPVCATLPVGNPITEQNMLVVFFKTTEGATRWESGLRRSHSATWFERYVWPHRVHLIC